MQDDHFGGRNRWSRTAGEDLDALGCRVGALIELARQVLDREGVFVVGNLERGAGAIDLRFGKNQLGGIANEFCADAVDFVALDDAQGFEAR